MPTLNEIKNSIFNIDIPTGTPRAGSILVAEPFLEESYFHHGVILLAEYGHSTSAMGLVLNKETQYTLSELLPSYNLPDNIPVYLGGPMENERLFYIHTLGSVIDDSIELLPGLWIGGNFDQVVEYLNAGYPVEGHIRFLMGYSGWERGQLDHEIRNHVWAVTRATSDDIMTGTGDPVWHRFVRNLGETHRGWRYHPVTPAVN